jgi:hypothetical protein
MTDRFEEQVLGVRAAFLDSRDDQERRQWTRDLNRAIGSSTMEPYKAEFMPPEDMLERCLVVSLREDDIVVLPPEWANDHGMPLVCMTQKHFKSSQKGNQAPHPTRRNRDGEATRVDAADLFLADPDRKYVRDAMYAIGRPRLIQTPSGDLAVNLWSPLKRLKSEADIGLFLNHVAFLIPNEDDRERFLDWLAHCEQKPHVLPHHGWLMWTEQFGIGRNWLASVLTRVWRGEVAPSLDLVALLGGSFNNALSCKRLACVDEIHIGSNNSLFTMAARLRQIMTEEIRVINPKYGKMTSEYNCTRWLIFSNHADALPIPEDDRRFEVVKNPSEVKSEAYYAALYTALDDPEFIAGICHFLATRDISHYNSGARPRMTEAKRHVIEASISESEKDMREFLDQWKSAGMLMFAQDDLKDALGMDPQGKEVLKHPLARYGAISFKRTKWGTENVKLIAISADAKATLEADSGIFDAQVKRIKMERGEGGLFASRRHTGPQTKGSSGSF